MKQCKCGRGPITSPKNYRCKDCNRERMAVAYKSNPDKMRQISYEYRKRKPEAYKEQNARYRMKLKIDVLTHYSNGNLFCYCCGVTNIEFLTLDHMDNDGKADRELTGGGHAAYRWLKSNGYPGRNFRIACLNCNAARYFYGQCPHGEQMVVAEDRIKYLGENI